MAVTVTEKGTEAQQPRSDEEWDELLHASMALAESPNLLVTPGRQIAKPEEMNSSAGPEELVPKDIQSKIEGNHDLWLKHVDELGHELRTLTGRADRLVQRGVDRCGDHL